MNDYIVYTGTALFRGSRMYMRVSKDGRATWWLDRNRATHYLTYGQAKAAAQPLLPLGREYGITTILTRKELS